MATLLLCSDEPILAEGLTRILGATEGIQLCGHCPGIERLREHVDRHRPDLLLLDMTAEVNLAALSTLQDTHAGVKIVLWVRTISTELALQSMSAGVRGVLRRTLPPETLIRCLMRVQDGELWFEKALTDTLLTARRYTLTRRESQLVALLSQGLKNKEIATAMEISEGSVKVYLSRLFQKLGVKDRFELALFGLKNLTSSPDSVDPKRRTGDQIPMLQSPRTFFMEKIPPQPITQNGPRLQAWR